MKFIGDYWDTVEDEHTIWSDVASFSLRQHTTKIFYVLFRNAWSAVIARLVLRAYSSHL